MKRQSFADEIGTVHLNNVHAQKAKASILHPQVARTSSNLIYKASSFIPF